MISNSHKNILMVMAHPDDEVIFGWPILQDPDIKKSLLVCSSDLHNTKRSFVKDRRRVLEHVCKKLNITDFYCFDYNSEFYRLETRKESLKNMLNSIGEYIRRKLESNPCIIVYTHNFIGEYGNIDHRLINYICTCTAEQIMYSDLIYESNWMPTPNNNGLPAHMFFTHKMAEAHLDSEFYDEISALYKEKKCWTWDKQPKTSCGIYLEK